jgi:hypothetical protein
LLVAIFAVGMADAASMENVQPGDVGEKRITAHSIGCHYTTIEFGEPESIITSLIALHDQRFYVFWSAG